MHRGLLRVARAPISACADMRSALGFPASIARLRRCVAASEAPSKPRCAAESALRRRPGPVLPCRRRSRLRCRGPRGRAASAPSEPCRPDGASRAPSGGWSTPRWACTALTASKGSWRGRHAEAAELSRAVAGSAVALGSFLCCGWAMDGADAVAGRDPAGLESEASPGASDRAP